MAKQSGCPKESAVQVTQNGAFCLHTFATTTTERRRGVKYGQAQPKGQTSSCICTASIKSLPSFYITSVQVLTKGETSADLCIEGGTVL